MGVDPIRTCVRVHGHDMQKKICECVFFYFFLKYYVKTDLAASAAAGEEERGHQGVAVHRLYEGCG